MILYKKKLMYDAAHDIGLVFKLFFIVKATTLAQQILNCITFSLLDFLKISTRDEAIIDY